MYDLAHDYDARTLAEEAAAIPHICDAGRVYLTLRPGTLAPETGEAEVEAYGRDRFGWLIAVGYEHDLTPILGLVSDSDVAGVYVEGIAYRDMDADLAEGELDWAA